MVAGRAFQIRRGTAAGWTLSNYVLKDGELGFAKDTRDLKIGDGSTGWNSLSSLANLLSRVARAGDTMTGRLRLPSIGTQSGTELSFYVEDTNTLARINAGLIYEGVNRVYSAANPPPVQDSAVGFGYDKFAFLPDAQGPYYSTGKWGSGIISALNHGGSNTGNIQYRGGYLAANIGALNGGESLSFQIPRYSPGGSGLIRVKTRFYMDNDASYQTNWRIGIETLSGDQSAPITSQQNTLGIQGSWTAGQTTTTRTGQPRTSDGTSRGAPITFAHSVWHDLEVTIDVDGSQMIKVNGTQIYAGTVTNGALLTTNLAFIFGVTGSVAGASMIYVGRTIITYV